MISSIQASTLCDCFVGVNLIVARYKVLRQLFSFLVEGCFGDASLPRG